MIKSYRQFDKTIEKCEWWRFERHQTRPFPTNDGGANEFSSDRTLPVTRLAGWRSHDRSFIYSRPKN